MPEKAPLPLPQEQTKWENIQKRETELRPISSAKLKEAVITASLDIDDFSRNYIDRNIGRRREAEIEKYWVDLCQKMAQMKEFIFDEVESEQEKVIHKTLWDMGKIVKEMKRRNQLQNQLDRVESMPNPEASLKDKILAELNPLNIESAKWQISVMKMILLLRRDEKGHQFIEKFWQTLEDLSDQRVMDGRSEAKKLKGGILGVVTTIDTLRSIGVRTYFSFAEQDAIQKIDLWGERDGVRMGFQIKSRSTGNTEIHAQKIEKWQSTDGLSEEEAREVRAQNIFLTSTRDYGRVWKRSDPLPFWVNLERHPGAEAVQDDNTGEIIAPSQFDTSDFVTPIEAALRKGGAADV